MQRAFFVVIHMLRIMEYFFDGAGLRLFPTSRLLILAFSYVVPLGRRADPWMALSSALWGTEPGATIGAIWPSAEEGRFSHTSGVSQAIFVAAWRNTTLVGNQLHLLLFPHPKRKFKGSFAHFPDVAFLSETLF